MTPATSLTPRNFHKQIGSAVWLLTLLACFAPVDWNGDTAVYVAGGNIVPDAELAERLAVSQRTIAKWRRRLRAAGVLGWLLAPGQGQGRVFWIAGANRVFGVHCATTTAEQKPADVPAIANAETALTAPPASRLIQ